MPIVTNVKCLFDMKPLPIKMSQKYDSFTEDVFHQLNTSQHITWVKFKCKIMIPGGNKLSRVLHNTH